jgi:hypothetical protein
MGWLYDKLGQENLVLALVDLHIRSVFANAAGQGSY